METEAWRELVRHRQTKGSATDRLHLNHRATPRLHNAGFSLIGRRPFDRLRADANPHSRDRGSPGRSPALSICAGPQRAALDDIANNWCGPRGRRVFHVCNGPSTIGQGIRRHAASEGTGHCRPLASANSVIPSTFSLMLMIFGLSPCPSPVLVVRTFSATGGHACVSSTSGSQGFAGEVWPSLPRLPQSDLVSDSAES